MYKEEGNIEITYQEYINVHILTTNNRQENAKELLEKNLIGNYFQIQYEYNDFQDVIAIHIQKIDTGVLKETEKNNDLKFTNENALDIKLIQKVESTNTNLNSEYYVYDNLLVTPTVETNIDLSSFFLGLVYDANENNFVPINGHTENYSKIKSYKVYSSGMEITLQDGVFVTNKYYTLRLNRYDKEFTIQKSVDYYYLFEPVVTMTRNSTGNTVLEIKFPQTFLLKDLKNIELAFGYME